jgi:hypothetical protein
MLSRFDFIRSNVYRHMMENAYEIMNVFDLWIWLKDYNIPPSHTCIFYTKDRIPVVLNDVINSLNKRKIQRCNVEYPTIYIIHDLQHIALYGLQHYKEHTIHSKY